MKNLYSQFESTRTEILNRVRKVSAYFSIGGGKDASAGSERELAWTSDEQIQRAKEFRELAAKTRPRRESRRLADFSSTWQLLVPTWFAGSQIPQKQMGARHTYRRNPVSLLPF